MKTYTVETLEPIEVLQRTYTVTAENEEHARELILKGGCDLEREILCPSDQIQFVSIREKI